MAGFDGNWGEERSNISHQLSEIKKAVDELSHAYFGNGKEGVATRLDRLEREADGRLWVRRAMWAALITAITVNSVALVRVVSARATQPQGTGQK